tara:strand:+ start:1536 stop:2165 length:630 start_codon:yes stop_codon:yes gene_type:complete
MYQLNPASLDIESNKDDIKSIYKRSNTNSKTYKNKKNVNFAEDAQNGNSKTKINSILSKLHINDENIEYDDNDENNFRQYHNDEKDFLENDKILKSSTVNKPITNKVSNYESESYSDPKKILSNFDDSYQDNLVYYNNENNPVSYNNNINSSQDNKELLSKLEYIIQLLEQQHNEKTNHIVEELILYLFLGIFIIFVLDSFSKATKYTR